MFFFDLISILNFSTYNCLTQADLDIHAEAVTSFLEQGKLLNVVSISAFLFLFHKKISNCMQLIWH